MQPVRKAIPIAVILAACLLTAGCVAFRAPFKPPQGGLFTNIKAPLQTDFHDTPAQPAGHGKVSSFYLFVPFVNLSFAWEDCSVAKAVENGTLAAVDYADYEMFSVLGVFGRMTVHAYGPVK